MAKNDTILKPLKIKNSDTELSERIDGVTSQMFPDSNLVQKTDVANIEAENATETLNVKEELNKEENVQVAGLIKWPKKNKPKDDNTITGLQEKQEDILKTKVDENQLFIKEGNQIIFRDLDEVELKSLDNLFNDLDPSGKMVKEFDIKKISTNKG